MWIFVLGFGFVFTTFILPAYFERKRQKELEAKWEHNRLFWSIRDLEKEVLGIDWCSSNGS